VGVGVIFLALYFWARKQPLPAAIVGLVLFITYVVLLAVLNPATIAQGILMKIIVIAVLVNSIQAGVKYRQLQQGSGGGGFPVIPGGGPQ
jgi:hypothetical protein